MRPEITFNNKSTELSYLELEPKGMNQFAPRIGYYKVIRRCTVLIPKYTLEGVVVHWKLNIDDEFDTSFETRIQLESFSRNPYPDSSQLLSEDLTNKTIHVRSAEIRNDDTRRFIVDWEILPGKKAAVGDLNKLLQSGELDLIASTLESTKDLELNDEDIDYGVDDSQDF